MPRGIPWDDLPNRYKVSPVEHTDKANKNEDLLINPEKPLERDIKNEVLDITRRFAFGMVCGSITGATFGFVDVLRDPKLMTAKASVATQKILRFTFRFGGFFGSYHAIRKTLKLYFPQKAEENVMTAAALSITPLIVFPALRPMIPYSLMMIGLDAFNGLYD